MRELFFNCLKQEDGTEAVEYALLLGLIVLACIGLMGQFGVRLVNRWESIVEGIDIGHA